MWAGGGGWRQGGSCCSERWRLLRAVDRIPQSSPARSRRGEAPGLTQRSSRKACSSVLLPALTVTASKLVIDRTDDHGAHRAPGDPQAPPPQRGRAAAATSTLDLNLSICCSGNWQPCSALGLASLQITHDCTHTSLFDRDQLDLCNTLGAVGWASGSGPSAMQFRQLPSRSSQYATSSEVNVSYNTFITGTGGAARPPNVWACKVARRRGRCSRPPHQPAPITCGLISLGVLALDTCDIPRLAAGCQATAALRPGPAR